MNPFETALAYVFQRLNSFYSADIFVSVIFISEGISNRSCGTDESSSALVAVNANAAPVFWLFTQFLAINLPGLTNTGWL